MSSAIIVCCIAWLLGSHFKMNLFQTILMAISYIPFWEVFNSKEALKIQKDFAEASNNPDTMDDKEVEKVLNSYEGETDMDKMMNDPVVKKVLNVGSGMFKHFALSMTAVALFWYFPISGFVTILNAIAHKSSKMNRFVMILLNILTFGAIVAAIFYGDWRFSR